MPDPRPGPPPAANSYEQSLALVLQHARPLPVEEVPFAQALGRVLAEPLVSDRDEPPGPKSAMDGYALRAQDTLPAAPGRPVALAFTEVVGAGHLAQGQVGAGGAVRIMTGALLPQGADAVVKLEDTLAQGPGRFALERPLQPGENVVPAGARMASGEPLLPAGEVLDPLALGLLAGMGRTHVRVRQRPRVALLALGDELVELGGQPRPGQILVTNLYVLQALVERYGGTALSLGVARDDPAHIRQRLHPVLEADAAGATPCHMLLTLGGSHKGDFDFVHSVLEQSGAQLHFSRTRLSAGPSTLFATQGALLWFGLPGSPGASWSAFEVLVRPALWRLAGRARLEHPTLWARLAAVPPRSVLPLRPGRANFIPCRLRSAPGAPPEAVPLVGRHPQEEQAALRPDGLIRVLEGQPLPAPGDWVAVDWLGGGAVHQES